ncbi:response regulator [Deinococcus humi]|uniref:CheY-like chemotaxis protein n=1 Tax=Deinococcus humi TaxID=662880 RepID=A0A7W8JYD9_9DEIO|nr:response regulator [Deinococcus humi]MBB5365245.1 CheY-like chemotaxis protein [Deinococcus humi]GGO35737.1 hypothetical protein GCM10008949_38710 [Deinococcus humi]
MIEELRRVLLVEDDPDIQAVALIALEDIGGLQVQACDSGSEALERFAAFNPDLVLLDVMMPGMSGPETLAALRALPGGYRVPVVFMTAKVQKGEVQKYLELGAAGVIPKPFEPMTLADDLRGLVQIHHSEREAEDERVFRAEVAKLSASFLQEFPALMTGLWATWAAVQRGEGDATELSRQGHRLVGTAGTLGHAGVAQIAAALERDRALTGEEPLDGEARRRVEGLLVQLAAQGGLSG